MKFERKLNSKVKLLCEEKILINFLKMLRTYILSFFFYFKKYFFYSELDKSYAELEGRFSRVTHSFATFISILIKIEINVQLACLRPMASVHSKLEKSSYLFFFNIFFLFPFSSLVQFVSE